MPFTKQNLQKFLRDALVLDDRNFKLKYLVSEKEKALERKKSLIGSFKGLQQFEESTADAQTKTAVIVFISQELTVNQIVTILKHFAHARRRVQIISQKVYSNLSFLASIGDYPRQSLEIRQAGQPVQVDLLNLHTYSARWILQKLSDKLRLPVDEYSHIPEEKLDLVYRAEEKGGDDDYLYDDL